MKWLSLITLIILTYSCNKAISIQTNEIIPKNEFVYDTNYIANSFRIPVGNPPAVGYYDAQPFTKNNHLGEDWNGNGGGNTDLGDTVYACANGYVKFAEDVYSGWGKVVRILHQLPNGKQFKEIESIYAHLDTFWVKPNTYVKINDPIGTIGNAHGIYWAHLHFELRSDVTMELGGGYSPNITGFLNPKKFMKEYNK